MGSRPNVVWLTLDSIRYDRTTMAGWERATTPNLARIASEGVSFDRCFSHGIWSLPSAASILTGTYPSYHQVGNRNETLPDELATVPESFAQAGYTTIGLSANPWFSPSTGLDRGFDTFEYLDRSNVLSVGLVRLCKFLLQLHRHSGGYTTDMAKTRSEYLMMGLVRRALEGVDATDEPFFLYAHTEGAHTPYYPPAATLETFADDLPMAPARAREFVYDVHQNLYREIADGLDYSDDEWTALEVMYDTLIRYIDGQVGQLFEYLRSLDVGPTVVVVTADHGDLLGERGLLSHKVSLHDGNIHVPLVVHGLDALAESAESVVQHSDVVKTLLRVAGSEAGHVQGVDLREERREAALAQRGQQYFERTMDRVRSFDPSFDASRYHTTDVSAVRTAEYKYVESEDRRELLAVADETEPIGDRHPAVRERLASTLADELAALGSGARTSAEAEFTDDMQRRLEDLGYL